MGLFSSFKGEFVDIIEWIDNTNDTIVYRFKRHDNEIKNKARLIVRESQIAVFVDNGQYADVFLPGSYTLTTENLPILSTLKGWKHGFDSPFKSEVYFLSTKRFTDMGWGTPNPVIIRDPELGPIRVRAFGNYSIKINDPKLFLSEISGTDGDFQVSEIEDQLRNYIVTGFSDALAESKIPVIDFSSKYDEIGEYCNQKLAEKFKGYGLELMDLLVENISLPEELETIFDKKSSMNMLGNLNDYAKFQAAESMEDAANNPSGDASAGIGMGMGMGMAQNMAQSFNQQGSNTQSTNPGPPPIPKPSLYFYVVDGAQQGPVGITDLKNLIAANQVSRNTLLWKEGMSGWEPAESIGEVKPLFGSVPPPIPG